MNVLQKEISSAMPYARRYGRALTGDGDYSDSVLARAAKTVMRRTLPLRFLLPEKMILPLLLTEFHRQLDSNAHGAASPADADTQRSAIDCDEMLYVKIDQALCSLPELQRRVYLLFTLAQFDISVVARMLSLPTRDIQALFQQAHVQVANHMATEPM